MTPTATTDVGLTLPPDLPFSHGPRAASAGTVEFRLWAPSCDSLGLLLDDREPLAMSRAGGGWFTIKTSAKPGSHYRFRLPDGTRVPDPASRQQDLDAHGASILTDPAAYRWKHESWRGRPWHEAVVYELHAGVCGGFAGITDKLAALAELGVTAIELMPISQFPGARNWGYDGVLPFAPAAAYGTPDQLKRLIDTAHGLGLMVLLDVVYNHFGPDGNFLPAYAKTFFREDRKTGWGAAIDTRERAVRDYFIENAVYWLDEFRFDGLRLDAVHALDDDEFLVEFARTVRGSVSPERFVHLVIENENNSAQLLESGFTAQWNDDGHHALHVLLTGESEGYYEDYVEEPALKLARCLEQGFIYQGERSPHIDRDRGEPSGRVRPSAFVLFLQNHDHIGNRAFGERLLTLSHEDAFRAAAALVLLAPQIPLLFMGEEDGARDPFLFFTDHDAELARLVREGRAREFRKFTAFSGGDRKLSDPNEASTFEASIPRQHEGSPHWRRFYKHLLDIRRQHVTPGLADASGRKAWAPGPSAVAMTWQDGNGAILELYCNLGADPVTVEDVPNGMPIYSTSDGAEAALRDGTLAGHSTCLFSIPALAS